MDPHAALSAWESFYVIVGSSSAALTGLQFVVIALIHDTQFRTGTREIAAFGTPTIVHLCAVLLISAILSAPWPALTQAAIALGAVGLAGLGYAFLTFMRARATVGYKPVLEDWIWHVIFPKIAYLAVLVAAIVIGAHETGALFALAGASLLLLFTGIHNAWDTVTFIALGGPGAPKESSTSASDG